jgi:hypothetical protein
MLRVARIPGEALLVGWHIPQAIRARFPEFPPAPNLRFNSLGGEFHRLFLGTWLGFRLLSLSVPHSVAWAGSRAVRRQALNLGR